MNTKNSFFVAGGFLPEAKMDIDDAISAVKRFESQFLLWASRTGAADGLRPNYHTLRMLAADLVHYLEDHRALFGPLSADLGDLSDLPEELRAELTIQQADELETQILSVIKAYGGTADLDQILVGLFRKFKVVQKRRFLQNKVWRLTKKGAVHAIAGRRGLYSLGPAPETEAELQIRMGEGLQEAADNGEIQF
jgi:hypothetical protein